MYGGAPVDFYVMLHSGAYNNGLDRVWNLKELVFIQQNVLQVRSFTKVPVQCNESDICCHWLDRVWNLKEILLLQQNVLQVRSFTKVPDKCNESDICCHVQHWSID